MDGQREALFAFYRATGGDSWARNDGWCTEAPLDEWFRVETNDEGSVVKLILRGNNLVGSLPKEILTLEYLAALELSHNKLSGPIPKELGRLTMLIKLKIVSNQLTGSIPEELGCLIEMKYLDLSFNQLTGPIPRQFGLLVKLEYVNLADNQLTGPIPQELGLLIELESLDLSSNKLDGSIPEELGLLVKAKDVNLSENQLTGPIPRKLEDLKKITYLNLSHNQLTGTASQKLGHLTKLETGGIFLNEPSADKPSPDVEGQGSQAEVEALKAASGTASDDGLEMMNPQHGVGEGTEQAQLFEASQKEGEAGSKPSEGGLPEDIQEKPAAGDSAKMPNDHEAVLAKHLPTEAVAFLNESFGVELVLEDGSLDEEITEQVVVKKEVRLVTCSPERDTSRTHDELVAQMSGHDDESPSGEVRLLAMPIVHGPEVANFNKPAKLRFFVGNLWDLEEEIREESEGGDSSSDAIEKRLRAEYEPLISADGKTWKMLKPFDVIFKPFDGKQTEVWLETRLHHFSMGSMGKVLRHFEDDQPYFEGRMPFLMSLFQHRNDVIFGNATEVDLLYYAIKKQNVMEHHQKNEGEIGAMGVQIRGAAERGMALMHQGVDDIMDRKVYSGTYRTVEMFKDGRVVHEQLVFAVFLQKTSHRVLLTKDLLSRRRMFIVLPKMTEEWLVEEEPTTLVKISIESPLPVIKKFIMDHSVA